MYFLREKKFAIVFARQESRSIFYSADSFQYWGKKLPSNSTQHGMTIYMIFKGTSMVD
jgi:hypothetical protein